VHSADVTASGVAIVQHAENAPFMGTYVKKVNQCSDKAVYELENGCPDHGTPACSCCCGPAVICRSHDSTAAGTQYMTMALRRPSCGRRTPVSGASAATLSSTVPTW
jgi:hypothetical protein